MAKNLWGVAGL